MVINIFGKRGSGKTTTIKGVIQYCQAPIIIIDILGNFDSDEYFHSKKLSEILLKITEFKEKEKLGQTNFKTKEKVFVLQTHDYSAAIDYTCAALWETYGGTLILDEVDAVSDAESPCFDQAIRYGRNRGIHIITGCRRPAEINRNLTAAGNKFYCFMTHEFRDIDYFKNNGFGNYAFEISRCAPYSGLFLDHDKQAMGKFHIDIKGNVFHDKVWAINSEKKEPDFQAVNNDDEMPDNDNEPIDDSDDDSQKSSLNKNVTVETTDKGE